MACRMRCRTKSTSAWLLITSQTPSHASTCDHPFAFHPSPSDVTSSLASCSPRLAFRPPSRATGARTRHTTARATARKHPPACLLLRTIPNELIAGLGRDWPRDAALYDCMLYAVRTTNSSPAWIVIGRAGTTRIHRCALRAMHAMAAVGTVPPQMWQR